MTHSTPIAVQLFADKFVVSLNGEYLMASDGEKMAFDSAQEAGAAAKGIQAGMDAWNAMTADQRAAALKAAGTASPAIAMRYFGYRVPFI